MRPARVRLLVAGVVLAALGGSALALGHVPSAGGSPSPVLLAVLAVLLLLGDVPLLRLRVGSQHLAVVWVEAVAVLALALVPPWLAVPGFGALLLLSEVLQRRPLVKAVYNAAADTVALAVAAGVLALLVDGPVRADRPEHLLALVVAMAAFIAVLAALADVVVAAVQGARFRDVAREGLAVTWVSGAANVGVGLTVLVLLESAPAVLLAVPVLAGGTAAGVRAYLHAKQERDVWRQLEVATRELNRLEEGEVVSAALHRARELFRCDDVELHLVATGTRTARSSSLRRGDLSAAGASGHDGLQVQLDGAGGTPALATTLSAPLETPSGRIGTLRLLFAGEAGLSDRERQVLLTFSHSVSTTLQNARLHEDVRAEADRNAHAARHDALTGLPNRVLLHDAVSAALAAADGSTTALLLLDLDHFKEINDTLGHEAGDALLQQVAARLRTTVGDAGLVARLGGDEFAVLLTGLWSPRRAESLAQRLLAALAVPAEVDGLRLASEASIGIACHPQDADSAAGILRRADVAMYQAKGTRGAWVRYDADRDDSSLARLSLVAEFRQALERDEVVVHFQPQLDLRTDAVVSAEALSRWQHPERGLLLPGEFIPAIEQSGLVRPFTLRVLELALTACAQWNAGDGPRVRVAVNLAARSLLDVSLPDDVALLLVRTGARAADLVLEITETTAASELEVVEEVLARLRHAGVEISVDDFGTGWSSLAFLQRSGVDELKVDQGFVRGMLRNDSDAALVRATVQLAHSLGARAVAEGVEDADHARALRELGCDLAQGWHYGAAEPAAAMGSRLAEQVAAQQEPEQLPRVVRLVP